MRKSLFVLALILLLAGCGDTVVYIPEDKQQPEDGIVVHIPVKPEKPTKEETDPVTVPLEPENAETAPAQTEPEQKTTEPANKKPASSSNKGNGSGNKNNSTNKNPSGSSEKPTEPQPEATAPAETELPATEPPATEPPLYDISGYAVGNMEYAVLARINEYRKEEGLEQLWLDEYLCAIASCRSYESSQIWSHTRPDGRNYGSVLSDYGYGGSALGELLGYTSGDGAALVDKWMSSDAHRALLMSGSSAVGIGIYYSGGVTYVTCLLTG